ncbi:MAG: flagellar basal-body rod protein FlgG [Deltaproteobacteria bacterium]|nr:flagellar basal-body rod protein FlgG [Deltaproteobacteria bacterium]
MMRSLLTAATGMEAQQLNIDTIANNLANVNTTAFKRSRANFHDLLYQTLRAPGQSATTGNVVPGGIQIGTGVKLSSVDKMFTEGAIQVTGNDLDFMIEGDGFFRLQKDDGEVVYTRNGHFSKDATGRIVSADGYALSPEIVIPADAKNITVGYDGTVTIKIEGETQELGQILLASFINPTGLVSLGGNNFATSRASGEPIVGAPNQGGMGKIGQAELESSNVNIVEEMVNMITGQRAYEISSKVIQTGDQMLQTTNGIR